MNSKYFVLTLILIFLSSQVFSAVVSEPNLPTSPVGADNTIIGVEIKANIESLRQEINKLPSEENILKYLNNAVTLQEQNLEAHKSTMIISQILINLCFMLLLGSSYFYLKSKGRV